MAEVQEEIEMSDIVMVYPKTGEDIGGTVAPPFGVLSASSIVHEEGYKVRIIDQRLEKGWKSELVKEVKAKPLFVGSIRHIIDDIKSKEEVR